MVDKKIAVCYLDSEVIDVINCSIQRYLKYVKGMEETKIESISMDKGVHENFDSENWQKWFQHTVIIENAVNNKISGYAYFLKYQFDRFNQTRKDGVRNTRKISYEIILLANCSVLRSRCGGQKNFVLANTAILKNRLKSRDVLVKDYDFSHSK